jgi:hypothetical protein
MPRIGDPGLPRQTPPVTVVFRPGPAERVNARERRASGNWLVHAKLQGQDLIEFRDKCVYGEWLKQLAEQVTEVAQAQAYRYIAFAEQTPPHGELIAAISSDPADRRHFWELWQRIDGHRPKEGGPGQPTPFGQLLPEGAKVTEIEVPAAYRDGGKPDGPVLSGPYLRGESESEWNLLGPYLSKNYGKGKTLTTHIKVGRAKAYLFKEVAALRIIKTANQAKWENEG